MNRKRSLIEMHVLLVAAFLSGCAGGGSGVPYQEAVGKVEAMLVPKVDRGIFPFTKNGDQEQTVFRFIEGSRREKVDHATPLRVVVTITRLEDGRESAFAVEAHEHGLKFKTRDEDAEKRWRAEVSRVLEQR